MISAYKKFKDYFSMRRILLVCAGSGKGRVPYAIVSRKSAQTVKQEGDWLSFDSSFKGKRVWTIRILTENPQAAAHLADSLKRKKIYSLCPDDFSIRTITLQNDASGPNPKWIGGDISLAGVDSSLYTLGGNNAYGKNENGA
ncbi:MAG: hypothetical protein LBK99_18875 [Opitutaceae bacterium]|jgi:hypothetical protein|nr:hypothetical protein [Opitutaceae bacterium]